jgi:1,4-dihydroxy-2-naphthoyl-CoA hydrolase
MSFTYFRTVRFQDTDAAGVVYFANVLTICHEAYEASLAEAGIDLRVFFSGAQIAVPIVHASVDFLRPMFCGDRLLVRLAPQSVKESEFLVTYQLFFVNKQEPMISRALTRHVCIDPHTRTRQNLPVELTRWLDSIRETPKNRLA